MLSPYSDRNSVGLSQQVADIMQLDEKTSEALFFLCDNMSTAGHGETFQDIYDFVLTVHPKINSKRLFESYEKYFQLRLAKQALEKSLEQGNASVIKKALDDLESFNINPPDQIVTDTLTDQQEQVLRGYMDMLDSYEVMYKDLYKDQEDQTKPEVYEL